MSAKHRWSKRLKSKAVQARHNRRSTPGLDFERCENRLVLATITVTALGDNTDVDGFVTLREAITAAETDTSVDGSTAGSGADTIVFSSTLSSFAPAVVGLTVFDTGTDNGEFGPTAFKVTTQLTIEGPTNASGVINGVTLERTGTSPFRLFHVTSTGNLTIRYLTIKGGLADGKDGGGGGSGGGGSAGLGGGLFNQGTLTIVNCTLTGNTALGGDGQNAGGTNAGGGGGGLGGNGGSGGNPSGGAGGTPNGGGTGAAGGIGGGGGGGSNSTNFNGTANAGDGGTGGLFGGGGGGGYALSGGGASGTGVANAGDGGIGGFGGGGGGGGSSRCIQSCSTQFPGPGGAGGFGGGGGSAGLSGGNGGGDGGGGAGMGGAIFNHGGTVNIRTSTISGNSAIGGSSGNDYYGLGSGNAGSGLGGGLFNRNGTVTIINSTITNNTVQSGVGTVLGSATGGGIYTIGDGATATLTLNNSIVANSSAGLDYVGNNINAGINTSSGINNLIESRSGFSGGVASTSDPLLGPLMNNGGPTATHDVLNGSPVIDAGDNAVALTQPTDQRRSTYPRLIDGDNNGTVTIDIGAVEYARVDYGDAPDFGPGRGNDRSVFKKGLPQRYSFMGPNADLNFDASSPAVAYSATSNEYFVVWSGDTNTGGVVDQEFEVYGQRVSATGGGALGGVVRISTQGTDGDTTIGVGRPAVAWNSVNNTYLVVWHGELNDGEFEIFGQRVNSSGALVGSNFRVSDMGNTDGNTSFTATNPAVAFNATDNHFLVVWQGDDDATGDNVFEIFGQRIGAGGVEIGTNDFRISEMGAVNANFDASDPAVAWNSVNNRYMVVWTGDFNTQGAKEIYRQALSNLGADVNGGDVRISDMGSSDSNTAFTAAEADLAYNATNNQFLVVWRGDDNENGNVDNDFEIFGQRISGAGNELGENDFRISDMGGMGITRFTAFSPAVAYNSTTNQYLVVWRGDDDESGLVDNENEIFAQQVDFVGLTVGPNDFVISSQGPAGDTQFFALSPAVAFNSTNNQYIVVWEGDVDQASAGEREIFGQRLDHQTLANYNTLRGDEGPRHIFHPALFMGTNFDAEIDGVSSTGADRDDTTGVDDEDGLTNPAVDLTFSTGATPAVHVKATNNTGSTAKLFGWIDYNGDGFFSGTDERTSVNVPNGSNNVTFTLNFPVVPGGSVANTIARFRLALTGAGSPTGWADTGEVEDYPVSISLASPMVPPPGRLGSGGGNNGPSMMQTAGGLPNGGNANPLQYLGWTLYGAGGTPVFWSKDSGTTNSTLRLAAPNAQAKSGSDQQTAQRLESAASRFFLTSQRSWEQFHVPTKSHVASAAGAALNGLDAAAINGRLAVDSATWRKTIDEVFQSW